MPSDQSSFLFLQAPPGPFVTELADALAGLGHDIYRVNFCLGDAIQWGWRPGESYRGSHAAWPEYLNRLVKERGITDVLYYGDRLPYHRAAAALPETAGVRAMTYEFGYLRPDWITLERRGMSALSHFPLDPQTILKNAEGLPQPDHNLRYSHDFSVEAFREVVHHLSTYFGTLLYPRYDADSYYNPLLNYLSYIPRLAAQNRRSRRAELRTRNWIADKRRYTLVPLQMQNDFQLRYNAQFRHQSEVIDLILESLAKSAPPDMQVVFKIHPLDNGWERWSKVVGAKARALGLARRVSTIDGGHLPTLLDHCERVIVINSTVGIHAILARRPTLILGLATFDIPGLTHQGSIDGFWSSQELPDLRLRDAFIRLLANTVQIRGSFYNREGRKKAIEDMSRRLIERTVNEPGGFVDPPPRLDLARSRGIPLLTR